MPELPEVEVVRAGLEPAVTGATITAVTVFDERSLRRHDGPSEDFAQRLEGGVFATPRRRGKFLWIPLVSPQRLSPPASAVTPGPLAASEMQDGMGQLSAPEASESTSVTPGPAFRANTGAKAEAQAGEALVVHLGMSGQVLLRDPGAEDRLTRIRLDIEHPTIGRRRLNFVDQRIFGSMAIDELVPVLDRGATHGETVPSQVAHIARDPLDPLFDEREFFARLARRNTGVKRALLDQGLVSGIGNIYADESLWAARIHYEQSTSTLSRPRARLLLAEVRAVMLRALAEGGTSFDEQYKNVNGTSGYFERSLQAYGQQGEPCPRCGRPIVREQFMNRGSHFCPFCQRRPRTAL